MLGCVVWMKSVPCWPAIQVDGECVAEMWSLPPPPPPPQFDCQGVAVGTSVGVGGSVGVGPGVCELGMLPAGMVETV